MHVTKLFSVLMVVGFLPLVSAHVGHGECVVDVGLPGVSLDTDQAHIGGCQLGVTDSESVVSTITMDDPSLCRMRGEITGDNISDIDVVEGTELPEGARVIMFCDAGLDLYGAVALSSGAWV